MYTPMISPKDLERCIEIDSLGILARDGADVDDYIIEAEAQFKKSAEFTFEEAAKYATKSNLIKEAQFPSEVLDFFLPYYNLGWVRLFYQKVDEPIKGWVYTIPVDLNIIIGHFELLSVPFVTLIESENKKDMPGAKHELIHALRINVSNTSYPSYNLEEGITGKICIRGCTGYYLKVDKKLDECRAILEEQFNHTEEVFKLSELEYVLTHLTTDDICSIAKEKRGPLEYLKSKSHLLRFKIMLERLEL